MTTQITQQISGLIEHQVPAFVRQNHTKFIDFLRLYYEYLDQQENINDYIHHVIQYLEVDSTTQNFIDNFFEELRDFPKKLAVDKRLLIKHVHDFYAAKGTTKAYELLFRILFNEDIEISYPSENILKTSNGDWKQNIFITIQVVSGELPVDGTTSHIEFENKFGKFKLLPNKIEAVEWVNGKNSGVTHYRLHFPSTTRIFLEDDQYIEAYHNSTRTFLGKLIKSPSKIKILNGGKYWQLGGIFILPGTYQDTICKVTGVNSNGGITSCSIMQHGYSHNPNQNVITSPFPNKPSGSSYDITKTMVSYNPTVYHHTIDLFDYGESSDSIIGTTSEQSIDSYYLEDYSEEDYSGVIVFSQKNIVPSTNGQTFDYSDITIDQWLESRTTLVYEFENISRGKGYFDSDKGKLSNTLMRLSDNYFYQLFSYLIHSGKQISDYRNAIHLVHPAGLKYFNELQKTFTHDVSGNITSSRYLSVDNVYLNEISSNTDNASLTPQKNLTEVIVSNDTSTILMGKYLDSSITYTDESSSFEFSVYSDEGYSSEGYSEDAYILTLTN